MFFKHLAGANLFNKKVVTTPHERVARWTKNVFEPVCQDDHSFMFVIVHLQPISLNNDERQIKGEPLILLLDSMNNLQIDALSLIREGFKK